MKRFILAAILALMAFAPQAEARHRTAPQYELPPQCKNPDFPCNMGQDVTGHRMGIHPLTPRLRQTRVERSEGQIVSHPAGCPYRQFCGCGVSVYIFGHPVRGLYLAENWGQFRSASPGPGMVAWRPGHVFAIKVNHGDGTVTAYDPNSGGHQTRIHRVSLSGYHVVDPRGGKYAGLPKKDAAPKPKAAEAKPEPVIEEALERNPTIAHLETYEGQETISLSAYAPAEQVIQPQEVSKADEAKKYLIATATSGGVMDRMTADLLAQGKIFAAFKAAVDIGLAPRNGKELAVESLHPRFAIPLANAIRTARAQGMDVGVFSCLRPTKYGVGGFRDKGVSCHTYAMACDLYGVNDNYPKWVRIAKAAGLYRPFNTSWERNHWQGVPDKTCSELRPTVTASGPKSLTHMWKVAERMFDRIHSRPSIDEGGGKKRYAKHHKTRYAHRYRKHRRYAGA